MKLETRLDITYATVAAVGVVLIGNFSWLTVSDELARCCYSRVENIPAIVGFPIAFIFGMSGLMIATMLWCYVVGFLITSSDFQAYATRVYAVRIGKRAFLLGGCCKKLMSKLWARD